MEKSTLRESEKKILRNNEADANKKVASVMFTTFCIYTLMYILDLIGVFIIDKVIFTIAYLSSSILLLSPLVLNKVFNPSKRFLKYVYISFSAAFLFITILTLSYHAAVIYIYPIAVASVYFSRRQMNFSIILTCLITIAGQIISYKINLLNDANYLNFMDMIIFGVIPRTFTLLAISALLYMLNSRSRHLLSVQLESIEKIKKHNDDFVTGIAHMIEGYDEGTGSHLRRTKKYAKFVAEELKKNGIYLDELNDDFIDTLYQVAPLHDIGKFGIPREILMAERRLTDEEFEFMKTHTVRGGTLIKEDFGKTDDELYNKMAYDVAMYHHEKWNGFGYPEKKSGEDIPLVARIMAIADVFDAISSKRCYRDAMDLDSCFKIIKEGKGTHFDPKIAEVFLKNRTAIEGIMKEE